MAERLYAVVDVETTGGTIYQSRITDISVFLTNGHQIIDEFSSLVNPQMYIPHFITELTGIDNDMVAGAPTFDEIAQQVLDITQGATFVAHNVHFDFSMIAAEFKRLQYQFERPKLCTVRLSKSWIPGHQSYGLGRLCADLDIPIYGRHRARGDAEATVELFHRIYELSAGDPVMADQKWVRLLPASLSKEVVSRIPDTAGILYYYDQQGRLMEVESASNMFKTVTSAVKSKSSRKTALLAETSDIDFEETGSLLIAELKSQSQRIRIDATYIKPPKSKTPWQISAGRDLFGYTKLSVVPSPQLSLHSLFKSKKDGEQMLTRLLHKHKLCGQLCGLNEEVCLKSASTRCPGACQYLEESGSYNQRVEGAMRALWPAARFAIVEQLRHDEISFVLIDNYEYLGYGVIHTDETPVQSLADLYDHLVNDEMSFEKNNIIHHYYMKGKAKIMTK